MFETLFHSSRTPQETRYEEKEFFYKGLGEIYMNIDQRLRNH
jgi:hypothetical protein